MSDWHTLAVRYMDECDTLKRQLRDARREVTALTKERNGLLAKIHRLKDRRDLYKERALAYENALFELDGEYNKAMRGTEPNVSKAYDIAQCTAIIRRGVAHTYASESEIAPRLLKSRPHPQEVEEADGV